MKLLSFLSDTKNTQKTVKSAICLQGVSYPLLFGRACAQRYAELIGMSFSYQNMQAENQSAAMAALQTSFLGSTSCYWLGNFDDLSKGKQKVWAEFLKAYSGPHVVLFYSAASFNGGAQFETIELPDAVDVSLFSKIAQMLGVSNVSFASQLYRQTSSLSLDEAYLFVKYDAVLGKGSQEFVTDWLPDMIVPEVSLFSLSQALFDRKASSFFRLWKQLSHRYSAPFWTTFWSEQMWRAYHYVTFQKKGKQLEAKKIGYRLPFSFLNRTWRNHKLDDLKAYHHFLYEIDFHVKNGGADHALDLFYATVFLQS